MGEDYSMCQYICITAIDFISASDHKTIVDICYLFLFCLFSVSFRFDTIATDNIIFLTYRMTQIFIPVGYNLLIVRIKL